MKNETTRTKTLSGFSSRAVALVLCFVMLLTAIGSGSVLSAIAADFEGNGASVLLDAAKAGADVDAPADAAAADDKADAAAEDEAPLSKKADSDLADTGRDADIASTGWSNYCLIGHFNDWTAPSTWTSMGSEITYNCSGKTAADGYVYFYVRADSDYFYPSSDNETRTSGSTYNLSVNQNSNNRFRVYVNNGSVTFKVYQSNGTAVLQIVSVTVGSTSVKIKGSFIPTEWSSTADMTASGSNYYYSVTGDGTDKYFRCIVNGTEYYPWPENNTDVDFDLLTMGTYAPYDGSNDNKKYGATTTKNSKAFKFTAASGYNYKIWVNSNKVWVTKTATTTYYYLTGWLNGAGYSGTAYKFTGSGNNYTYTFNSTTAAQYLTVTDSAGNTYHPGSHPAANGAAYTSTDTDPTADNKWGITSGAKGKSITFTWNPTARTLSWTLGSGGDVDVYAKDGAAPINWDDKEKAGATSTSGYNGTYAYNYARIATTSITSPTGASSVDCDIAGGTSGSKYQYKSIASGTKITVKTTIANENSWRTKYYVAGWCVNGITYKEGTDTVGVNSNPSGSKADYTFYYTIPDVDSLPKDAAGNPVVEITPIYYLQSKTDTVTFYIEGYTDVQSKWGNTPYAYPFYGNLSGYQNTFGAYPGQPVVNVGGQMSIEIPIKSNAIYDGTNNGTYIKGITVNNGYADHVHRNLVYDWSTATGNVGNDKDHMQTYDFDDFYKIYAERTDGTGNHPNQIFFRFREETKTYNRYTYGGGYSGQFASSTSNLTAAQISTINNNNGWELLKDRHDRPVNIFGDYSAVSGTSQGTTTGFNSNALYVISTGYNANIAGDYGTMWKIYDGSNGTLITKDSTNSRYGIPPSLLHVKGNASTGMSYSATYPDANRSVPGVGSYTDTHAKYNNIYKALKAAGYNNKVVYVTYEKDTQDSRNTSTGEGAYRADGQWFYTFASDTVKSTIGIEYYNKSTGKWVADTVSASTGKGTTTQATAKFDSDSYASASNVTTSKSTVTSAATPLNFTASESGTNYAFDGWFLKYDNSYDPITGATNVGTIKSTANYQLIARYIPVVTGSLTVSYKLDPTSTGAKDTMSLSVKYGSNAAVNGTLGDDGVYRATITGVTHTTTASNIVVTLKAKPKNHGKVSAFGADDQVNASESSPTLPGGENTEITKTYTFTNNDLYSDDDHTNQLVTDLEYSAKIDATPHYYEFTYTFTDRGGATKNYTARGEITEDHYEEYVTGTTINDDFVKSRAPFESNFLQTLKLGTIGGKDYNTSTHTLTATATYNATSYTPVYDVKIKLPYVYRNAAGGSGASAYKKYTAANDIYVTNPNTFTLKANYDEFVTIGATETTAGAQTKVSKVVDEAADPNHTGNDFITAPNTLSGGRYFQYWEIKRLADNDTDQAAAPVISRIYFPDLNYRFYADSYVEAVYTDDENLYWSNVNKNHTNSELSCSVLYLESSRNQYNTVANGTSTSAANAADIIYNDFIFSYRLGDEEYIPASKAEIGMILERVKNSAGTAWVEGDSSITDMDSYKAANSSTENKTAIITGLRSGGTLPNNCLKQTWDNSKLNNRNYTEQPYPVYAQYGQTVADHSITFTTDGTMDNYVYRAWAYIKDSDGNVAVSDPAYFSMNYIASQNYSE